MTLDVTRGVVRLFNDLGLTALLEFNLPNGRRADVAGLDRKGKFIFAEVKSCRADFQVDEKWEEYLPFCDAFYFAVAETFPRDLLPEEEGLIVADGFTGAVLRAGPERRLAPARRKALTLAFARQAAGRALSKATVYGD
ncbi:MAG: DNA repair putative endonuclease MmcB [Pseudomonadota bacterium]